MTPEQRVQELGLKAFDWALPQGWVDDFYDVTDQYPVGHFVWCYDRAKVFGEPIAITIDGENALQEYNEMRAR